MWDEIVLIIMGLIAGFIDAIAGGGGLITIPSLAMVLDLGTETVATNKVPASMSAGIALLVYLRKGHFDLKKGLVFTACIVSGSFLGSQVSPLIPKEVYRYFLMITAPLILWLIFNKKLWQSSAEGIAVENPKKQKITLMVAGLVVGFYDGLWGPGGGTFMLLSLLFITKLPLMVAIAVSKFANLGSALSSLTGFAYAGYINWKVGLLFMIPVGLGAFIGAQLASKKAEKIVRPILVIVVCLLLVRVVLS